MKGNNMLEINEIITTAFDVVRQDGSVMRSFTDRDEASAFVEGYTAAMADNQPDPGDGEVFEDSEPLADYEVAID